MCCDVRPKDGKMDAEEGDNSEKNTSYASARETLARTKTSVQNLERRTEDFGLSRRQTGAGAHSSATGVKKPTLRQARPRQAPGPQCAFKKSMFNVSCNSH